jgi:DNA (cytosine-5)-methyltransferase 1
MRYLSVCSGIEAATAAWHPLGWSPVALSEIEKFPSAVLAHHYPNVPNLGDMTKFKDWSLDAIDLLVGGTPCQSFSVAGLRKGLDDPRGNLMLTYLAIADRFKPRWLVWENVPGVLSSNGGKDFATFLGGLAELGYGFAYRILDAQYCGVPQRRRRVFVVGYLGDWRRAAAVLFERHSMQRNSAPSREAGQVVAGTLANRADGGGFPGSDEAMSGYVQPSYSVRLANQSSNGWGLQEDVTHTLDSTQGPAVAYAPDIARCVATREGTPQDYETTTMLALSVALRGREGGATAELGDDAATCLRASGGGGGDKAHVLCFSSKDHGNEDLSPTLRSGNHDTSHANAGVPPAVRITGDLTHTLKADGFDASEDGTGREQPITACVRNIAQCLTGNYGKQLDNSDTALGPNVAIGWSEELTPSIELAGTIQYGGQGGRHDGVMQPNMAVRRLLPIECERLQGFPDGYTQVPFNGKPAADGPRYKALGNSMAVPCMAWIGQRIKMVESLFYPT